MTRAGWMTAVLAALAAVALGGCPGSLDDPERFALQCGDVTQDVFATSCLGGGCHGANQPAAGLDLESPGIAERVADVPGSPTCNAEPLADTAVPEASLLYRKLGADVPCGAPMPLGGALLTDEQRACVLAWIAGLDAHADAGSP